MVKQTTTALTFVGATASLGSRYAFSADTGDSLRKSLGSLDEMSVGVVNEEVYGTPTTLLGADSSIADANSIPDNLISFSLSSVENKPTAPVAPTPVKAPAPAPKPVVPPKPAAPKVKKVVPVAKPKTPPLNLTFNFYKWLDHSYWKKDRPTWYLKQGAGAYYFKTAKSDTKYVTDQQGWFWQPPLKVSCEESGAKDYKCQNPITKKYFMVKFISDSYNF